MLSRLMRRANTVVLGAGRCEIRFHGRGAEQLPAVLMDGPERALAWAARGREDEQLLTEAWAEGGAVVDLEARRLAFWAEPFEIGLRRAALAVVAGAWPGWRVEWVAHGAVSVARAAGLAEESVAGDGRDLARLSAYWPVEPPRAVRDGWRSTVIVGAEVHAVHSLSCLHLAALGERLVELVRRPAVEEIEEERDGPHELAGIGGTWDGGSLLIRRRELHVSHQDAVARDPGLLHWLMRVWSGWEVRVHALGVPEQRARAGLDPWGAEPVEAVAARLEEACARALEGDAELAGRVRARIAAWGRGAVRQLPA